MDFVTTACIVAVILRRRRNKRRRRHLVYPTTSSEEQARQAPRLMQISERPRRVEVPTSQQRNERRRRFHKYWVSPLNSQRKTEGFFHKIYSDLRGNPEKFVDYFKMSPETFDKLLELIRSHITFQDTSFREAITPEERLSVTLRYLASGKSKKSLALEYSMGSSTISDIIEHTCRHFWSCLQPIYMSEKTEDEWLAVAKQFWEKTHFPNCIGAIAGKHIIIERSRKLAFKISKYQKYASLILMGIADVDYCFSLIDVGAYGSESGASVLANCSFGKKLQNEQRNSLVDAKIPNYDEGSPLPFVLLGDNTFPLSRHTLRPYPKKNLSVPQKIYNNRLSYARRPVERAFGILADKWQILQRSLDLKLELCDIIIKACCILHNFVRKNDREEVKDEEVVPQFQNGSAFRARPSQPDMQIRAKFCDYFNSPVGALSWQYENI